MLKWTGRQDNRYRTNRFALIQTKVFEGYKWRLIGGYPKGINAKIGINHKCQHEPNCAWRKQDKELSTVSKSLVWGFKLRPK